LNKKYIILLLACIFVSSLFAQTQTSYSCDFEDPNECAQWTLNVGGKGKTSKNKWYIGAAGSFGINSTKGLYMSSGGSTGTDTLVSSYEAKNFSCFQQAYRSINLAPGSYTIQFDWRAMGQVRDKIYIYYIDNSVGVGSNYSTSTIALPTTKMPMDTISCRGKSNWTSYRGTFNVTSSSGKLMIMWYNVAGSPVTPAAAVDNIEIYQGTSCASPTNIRYDGNTASLLWNGSASAYDVMVYNFNSGTMTPYVGLTQKSLKLPSLTQEGMYYFYVRSSCQDGHCSPWVFTSKFVWIKGARCIDYLDLTTDNSGAAKCFTGGWEESYQTGGVTEHLKDHAGMVGGAYDDEESLHAIQYVPGLMDARTGNQLKTIPDGEIASIRLGGLWDKTGNQTSTIEYEYQVSPGVNDLLVLQYACVLEYVDYHPEEVEPRFKLEILDAQGHKIDDCSQADFKAGFGDTQTWHQFEYGGGWSTCDVRWCDWQQVTVSLRNYIGQKLTIRLTSYSCAQSAHFGYAYFTLNCENGELEGIACGDFSTDHFEAPEGFNYRWYKASDTHRTVLSTDRIFNISRQDTTIYLVDLVSKLHSNCYYTLTANPNPRFPVAEMAVSHQPQNCENRVVIANTSHVVYVNRIDSTRTKVDDALGSLTWDFGDGSPTTSDFSKVITHVYPVEGGDFDITCTAGMSNDVCVDDTIIHIHLPNLLNSMIDTVEHTCDSVDIDSHGIPHYARDSAYYVDTVGKVINKYGCEAWEVRTVYFHPTYDTLYTVRICEGTPYVWPADGKTYTVTTQKTHKVPTATWGCDSVMRLDLTVDPALRVDYQDTVYSCYDSAIVHIDYEILSGDIDSVFVFFPEEEMQLGFDSVYRFVKGAPIQIALPMNPALPGNRHAFIYFNGQFCSLDPIPFCVQVQYPASIVMMTDGFIGVQNALYNGGWQFADFSWYRNGQYMDVHQSYIPVSTSDVGAVYTVSLRREGESYAISSCPIQFRLWSGLNAIAADAPVEAYNLLGVLVGTYPSLRDATHALPTGLYVIRDVNQFTQTILVY